ncbi:MAG: hypothetical protein R6V01_06260 [Thermoplasmatota archaeon]
MKEQAFKFIIAVCIVLIIVLVTVLISVVYPYWGTKAPLKEEFHLLETEEMEFAHPVERGAVLGAHWFGRVQRTDGSFVYIFDPDNDTEIESYGYSLARHSASIYPLVWAFQHTGDERYLRAAEDAEGHIEPLIKERGSIHYILNGESSRLFDNALALIAYCYLYNATGEKRYLEHLEGLADLCLESLNDEGRFDYTYEWYLIRSFEENLMASGEGLLGLALSYRFTGEERYLEGFERAAEYHMDHLTYNNCRNMSTAYYSWMSSSFAEGYHLTGKEEYADACFQLSDWMIDNYYGRYFGYRGVYDQDLLEAHPELWGSFRSYPSMNSCTYSEGLGDVLGVAKAVNDTGRIGRYSDVLLNASRFILNLQYGEDEAYRFDSPHLVLGGFRHDLFDRVNEDMGWQSRWIRIDYTQHAIGALFRIMKNIPSEDISDHYRT